MHIHFDEDEYETVTESRPCTGCNGDRNKCHGQCNGYASISSRRRPEHEIRAIKDARRIARENEIIAEAAAIKVRRGWVE